MSASTLMAGLLATLTISRRSDFFAFLIQFFKQIIFSYFLNGHIQCTTRHSLDITQNNRIIQRFFIPITIEGFHQLAEIYDRFFTFLWIVLFQGFFYKLFNVLSIMSEAYIIFGIQHLH